MTEAALYRSPLIRVCGRKASPLHRGRTQLHFVATTNDTYAEGSLGHSRIEWFPTLLSVRQHMSTTEDAQSVPGHLML